MRVTLGGVNKSFAANHILKDLDLTFDAGEFVTLLGPSGCGKTTTLRCVAGLENPDAGSITAGDRVFVDASEHSFLPPHKRRVGMVFQSYALWPHMTVRSNVAYPLKRQKVARPEVKRRVQETLAAVGMQAHADRYPHELSGGQQQRVALARGLVSAGGLMLFDEPLSNLDTKLRTAMRTEIQRLHKKFGNTSIYVTHDQEEALALSDRVVIMNAGRVDQVGSPETVHSEPGSRFAADFVGFENILECQSLDSAGIATLDGGLQFRAGGERSSPTPGSAIAFRGKNVRPGKIDGAAIAGRGVIRDSTYVGEQWTANLETPGGALVAVAVPAGGERFIGREGDGTTVDFGIRADDVVVLER
ncbi:ABC transporter ATP-binding protein [Georgenia halophila]|uniref:ABC transporter ATP-binding protein n=1 Tax=Georgenia halophila TaxID=620889 RepID=A0ABP8LLA2_9MICO